MSFLWSPMLCLLFILPVFGGVYLVLSIRRQRVAARYGSLGLSSSAQSAWAWVRRLIPVAFFLLALAFLVFALARPRAVINIPRVVGTVILAFDVSGSMAAEDLEPTRIEAAKTAAQEFVERQPRTVQIGVVAFSDSGITTQAPTDDRDAILDAIKRLKPQRGTSLANGILASLKAIDQAKGPTTNYYSNRTPVPTPSPTPVPKGTYTSGMIVLLTDGENNENPDPLEVAQIAADLGVRIYTVGLGSVSGTDLKIEGFTVHTQLDEDLLKQISETTSGAYYNAGNAEDLRKVYENINTELIVKAEETEITSVFAGAGVLIMLVGVAFSLLWFGRLP